MISKLSMTAVGIPAVHDARIDVVDRNRADRCVGAGGNAAHINALVDDGVVVDIEIIDDGRVIVNLRHLGRWNAIIVRVRTAEILRRYEGETTCT